MRVHIEVNQTDITHGQCENPNTCAIARAVNRHLKRAYQANVAGRDQDGVVIKRRITKRNLYDDVVTDTLPLPGKALRFVEKYDQGDKTAVKPISFSLRIPNEFLR